MPEFIVKKAELEDSQEILDLYNLVHKKELTMEWFHWYNFQCPNGPNRLYVAENAENAENSKIIGAWGMLPLSIKLGKKVVVGSFSSLATVHPDFQGMGVFIMLSEFVQSEEKLLGTEVSLGIFGEGDFWGMESLEWSALCDLDTYFLRKRGWNPVSAQVTQVGHFNADYDPLLEGFSESVNFHIVKDHRFLNWRYLERPDQAYYVYSYKCGPDILGFIVLKYFQEGTILRAHILEIVAADLLAFGTLIDAAKEFAVKCDVLTCWQSPFPNIYSEGFKACGFERTKKSNILKSNFGRVKNLPPTGWWFTLGDYDVY